ncbi:MAG: AraC family ligand binding domain-containing protein [Sporichthyaceae bacterium]|nr:AraC family ligand binding domain-containing protein [Sporichthyaceae bacterium]
MSSVQVLRWSGAAPPTEAELTGQLTAVGLVPTGWGNAPGDRYDRHSHDYTKILYCVAGSIVFHTDQGDVELGPGDRLEIAARTPHAASVGPDGVRCVEARG